MALELNGTTGVSLVQDGVVTAADLASTLDLTGKSVTLPAGTGGKVLNVHTSTLPYPVTNNTGSFQDIGLEITLTPTSTSSKFLIQWSIYACNSYDTASVGFNLVRNGTAIAIGTDSSYGASADTASVNASHVACSALVYLDSPATTSSLTYKVQSLNQTIGTAYINRAYNNYQSSTAIQQRCYRSSMTILEIA